MVLKSILEPAALTQSGPKIDTELVIKAGVSRPDRAEALIIKGRSNKSECSDYYSYIFSAGESRALLMGKLTPQQKTPFSRSPAARVVRLKAFSLYVCFPLRLCHLLTRAARAEPHLHGDSARPSWRVVEKAYNPNPNSR